MASDGQIIHFNQDAYNDLIKFVDGVQTELASTFLKAVPGLTLDPTLGSMLRPGSPDWKPPVDLLLNNANTFGSSVQTKFTGLSNQWIQYRTALENAKDVFQKHDDLATMSAQDFLTQYPDLGNGGGAPSGGGGP